MNEKRSIFYIFLYLLCNLTCKSWYKRIYIYSGEHVYRINNIEYNQAIILYRMDLRQHTIWTFVICFNKYFRTYLKYIYMVNVYIVNIYSIYTIYIYNSIYSKYIYIYNRIVCFKNIYQSWKMYVNTIYIIRKSIWEK